MPATLRPYRRLGPNSEVLPAPAASVAVAVSTVVPGCSVTPAGSVNVAPAKLPSFAAVSTLPIQVRPDPLAPGPPSLTYTSIRLAPKSVSPAAVPT